jgi:3-deoxy-D-manno-octulosonate 8-phosphate phosphatase (KDO 8-P phosphatase)
MNMDVELEIIEKAKRIRMLVMDVDGVLTDGRIIYSDDGTEVKAFDVKDGVGIRAAQRAGLLVAVLTARVSDAVARRARELGITEVHQGINDKVETYGALLRRHHLTDDLVAYVGDDVNDLPLLARAGLSAAPSDAAGDVKARVAYVAERGGGRGAVREVIELILRAQGKWEQVISSADF